MIQRLRRFVQALRKYSSATEESDTAYNGLGSYSVEWHAVEYGLPLGLMTGLAFVLDPRLGGTMATISIAIVLEALGRRAPVDVPIPKRYIVQIRRELHYYLGSWALGFVPFVPLVDIALVLEYTRQALGL